MKFLKTNLLSYNNLVFSKVLFIKILSTPLFLLLFCKPAVSQSNLLAHKAFFEEQALEFGKWLDTVGVGEVIKFKSIEIRPNKLMLELKSNYETDDSLGLAWELLQNKYDSTQNKILGKRMFRTFSFLCDIGLDSVLIFMKAKNNSDTLLKIFNEDYIMVTESFPSAHSINQVELRIESLNLESTSVFNRLTNNDSVLGLRKAISNCLISYYNLKNIEHESINIDTSRTYYNEFTHLITCVRNEITSSGYWEFIQIHVEIYNTDHEEIGYKLELAGKLGSGIFCPKKRERFYQNIENHYPGKVSIYKKDIENRIKSCLQKN